MKTHLFPVSFLILACGSTALAEPTRRWSQGDPTSAQQQAMEWLNAVRRDPPGTLHSILRLAESDPIVTGFMRVQAPATVAQLESWLTDDYAISRTRSADFPNAEAISNAPLVFYPLFQQRAEALGSRATPPPTNFPALRQPPDYIYPTPIFGSTLLNGPDQPFSGPDATGGTARFGPFGADYAEVAHANLYLPALTAREWALSILTAAYPTARGSLTSFLIQGNAVPGFKLGHTRMAGIAITPRDAGARVLTTFKASSEFLTQSDLPFGATETVFITGVAYRDRNSNGFYDIGEGTAGITIAPDKGDWFAVTSTSGGFAIPVAANSGLYRLTATGRGIDTVSATATVGADNVKLDWSLPAAKLPLQSLVPASSGTLQLVGLSTRGLVETGAGSLIGGFVITGPAAARKTVLVRAVGPSLQTVGFAASEVAPATQLEVFDHRGSMIATNNGWTATTDRGAVVADAARAVGDFPLTDWPGGGGDSALLLSLAPGQYTAHVTPAPGIPTTTAQDRIGLVEIYDVSRDDGSRFVNISTRGVADESSRQMIVGCTLVGRGSARLLFRGVGPALTQNFGLSATLANPTLTLFDGAGRILGTNDDWSFSPQTAQVRELAAASGAFALPEDGLDSSLITLTAPGNYTAIIGAKSDSPTKGIALVELYETP
ncbi:MAG: hypothetical protein JNK23_08290 [Opitutaceae bacterium]|nr:hypothetical protein [Opitutaceae bacterium]